MINDVHVGAGALPSAWLPRHAMSDSKGLSAGMTATLTAELDVTVPPGLVAEIVRAVLDEGRQSAQQGTDELMMLEARRRIERFIRARTSDQRWLDDPALE